MSLGLLGACDPAGLGGYPQGLGDADDDGDDTGSRSGGTGATAGGEGDDGGAPPDDGGADVPVQFDFDCIEIDRMDEPEVMPPAGLQVSFRVLDCDGNPIPPLSDAQIVVLNDEKGEPFGAGQEGGSVSSLGTPSDYSLHTVLALDLSDSIHASSSLDPMLGGALEFLDVLDRYAVEGVDHEVSLVVFGRPNAFERVVDFTADYDTIRTAIRDLGARESLGSTDLYGVYEKSIDMVREEGAGVELVERAVVLFTDGTHEAGDEAAMREAALQRKADNDDLHLYTIGIRGAYDPERLAELASTEENFVDVEHADEASKAFAEIAYRLDAVARSNYVVGVCTPIALGETASLTIQLRASSDAGEVSDARSVNYPVAQLNGDLSQCSADEVVSTPPGPAPGDIEAAITADNAYGFGYGGANGLHNYYGGVENRTAGEIFNCHGGPERYEIPVSEAEDADYLYVVGYADRSTTQGVLGQFHRVGGGSWVDELIYTGDEGWEVCATGQDFDPGSGGPSRAQIDQQIQACNTAGLGPVGEGWVDRTGTSQAALAVGEDNTTPRGSVTPGNEFPVVCADLIDPDVRWMWINHDPQNVVWPQQSPFIWSGGVNEQGEFLLFRYPL